MEPLSKFVRGRLTLRQDQAGDHPDADLLCAFTERKLPAKDRGLVLAHLARCSDCRDVVAFASEPIDNNVATLVSRRTAGWWTWRWAGAAAIACLTTVVVWRPDWNNKHAPASELKRVLVPANQETVEPAQSVEPPKPSPPVRQIPKKARVPSAPLPHSALIQPAPSIVDGLPLSVSDAKEEQVSPSLDRSAIQSTANRLLPRVPKAQSFVSGAAIQPRFHRLESPLLNRPIAGTASKSVWKIRPSGTLQRSDDGGTTWHTVSVREGIEFYALSATGANLWVGGAGGDLFHSVDDGLHWVPVPVTDGNTRLTEPITKIDLHEDQSVELRTGSGSEWVSIDDGSHWRLK